MEPDQDDNVNSDVQILGSSQSRIERDEEDGIVLEFHDKKISRKFCLVLKEYDGKGIFIMKLPSHQDDIVGLYEIVHILKMKHLFYPLTVRDIVSRYVKDVSIYEDSVDKMNLVTGHGVRVQMRDPLFKVFEGGQRYMETLYLQNKKYLKGNKGTKEAETEVTERMFSKVELVGLRIIIVLFILVVFALLTISYFS